MRPNKARERLSSFVDGLQGAGRYTFRREEAEARSGGSPVAVQASLRRLKQKSRIVNPRRGFYVIVPAEYRTAGAPPAFFQTLGGRNDLLQYAHEAKLKLLSSDETTLNAAQASFLRAAKGSRWLRLIGLRFVGDTPITATTVFIAAQLGTKPSQFKNSEKAVTEHIEDKLGISVSAINQTIRAELLNKGDAKTLGTEPGGPILRTIRRYYDDSERLFLISDSRHPAERFAYEMSYKRTNG